MAKKAKTMEIEKTETAKEFQVGDLAVYPAHGVGRIESIECRTINGDKHEFYILKILDNSMVIMIPTRNVASVGLRDVIDKKEIPRIFSVLRKKKNEASTTRHGTGDTRNTWIRSNPAPFMMSPMFSGICSCSSGSRT
jgi:CarD family transcriptional regulator